MRVLLQRVTHGSVAVDGQTVGECGPGYVILLGIGAGDDEAVADRLAEKVVNLRLFLNDAGKFDKSLLEVDGEALVISQFTLYADARKGRRPGFTDAARPEVAEPLYLYFAARLRTLGVRRVATGRFGAMMAVTIHNDGPVTVMLDSAELPATTAG